VGAFTFHSPLGAFPLAAAVRPAPGAPSAALGGTGPLAPAGRPDLDRPREIFALSKHSAGTSVQEEPIYVVIPLRVDGCPYAACGRTWRSFIVKRTRPTPPGPDRVVPLALPPGEGDHNPASSVSLAHFPALFSVERVSVVRANGPHAPECGLRPREAGSGPLACPRGGGGQQELS
jgi:hypothetical protein